METIIIFHNSKWYYPFWALLFTLCLILLWWRRKDWRKGFSTFFWMIVLAIIVVYCPLLAHVLVPRFLPSWGEYERLSWVFFETPLISFTLIMLLKDLSNKQNRCLFIGAILICLLLIGSPDNRDFYNKPQNRYKISQDALDICNMMDELTPDGPIYVCVQLNSEDNYWSGNNIDGNLYYGIRTYASRFRLLYNCVFPEQYSTRDYKMNKLPEGIDYYLCPKAATLYSELENAGYYYAGESENFAVFRHRKDSDGETGS